MSKTIYDIALDNAKALGKLQGAVMWTIRYGNLSDIFITFCFRKSNSG